MTQLTSDQLKAQAHALRAQITAPELLQELTRLEDSLERFKPKIVLMGGWNAGKSTLINELLNLHALLPSSHLPETSTLIELTYDSSARLHPTLALIERSGARHNIDRSEFKEAIRRHPETYLHVGVANEVLRTFDLLDTPGDNSTVPRHQALFEVLMSETELTIYVIRADRFILRNDLKRLRTLCARNEARHVMVVFTHEDLITDANQKVAIEGGLRELLPELSKPLWVQAPLSMVSRELLIERLSSWVAKEGHYAHFTRVARWLEQIKTEQRTILRQNLHALRTGQQLARLSELERKHELAVCVDQSEALYRHFTNTLSLCETKLNVIFQERFELLRQKFWNEGQELDPLDLEALDLFNQRLITCVSELLTDVQTRVMHELAQALSARLPENTSTIISVFPDIQPLFIDDLLGDFSKLLEILPENTRSLVERIELILMRDPKLIILIKILHKFRAKENFRILLSDYLKTLSYDIMSPLHIWWGNIAQGMTVLFKDRHSQYGVQIRKMSQDNDNTMVLLEIQEKESLLLALN